MTTFQNKTFTSEDIAVDNNRYDDCTFDSCTLIFEGGTPPVFNRCTFQAIKIQLKGSAAQTTAYLNSLADTLPADVETVLDEVRSGLFLLPAKPGDYDKVITGEHTGRLVFYAAAITLAFLWLFGIYVYGSITQPTNTLAENEPLITEISFDLIPALPDTLGEAYDLLRDEQIANIEGFRWIDREAGIASIPVEDAYDILIEQGFPGAEASEMQADDTDDDNSDDGDTS